MLLLLPMVWIVFMLSAFMVVSMLVSLMLYVCGVEIVAGIASDVVGVVCVAVVPRVCVVVMW